jgi:hypothetical protein
MENQSKEINWRAKANRARKDIDNFTKYIGLVTKALDAQMALQMSRQRGENIAKLCNDLELKKDLLRHKHGLKLTKTK